MEKPGNLGALLRSADAAGVDAVVVCDPVTDLFNPQVVRNSQGALFSVPVAVAIRRNKHGIFYSQKRSPLWPLRPM